MSRGEKHCWDSRGNRENGYRGKHETQIDGHGEGGATLLGVAADNVDRLGLAEMKTQILRKCGEGANEGAFLVYVVECYLCVRFHSILMNTSFSGRSIRKSSTCLIKDFIFHSHLWGFESVLTNSEA